MALRQSGMGGQCKFKRKNGTDLCGIHLRAHKIHRVDDVILDKDCIYNEDQLYAYRRSNIYVDKLRRTVVALGLEKEIPLKQSKKHLMEALIAYFRNKDEMEELGEKYTEGDCERLIKAQAQCRGYLLRKRLHCVNKTDISTCEPLIGIARPYYFDLVESSGFRYGFDIRSFAQIIKLEKGEVRTPSNPYSRNPIPENVIMQANKIIRRIKRSGAEMRLDKGEKSRMTLSQIQNDKILRLFQRIDMLDNYTDNKWFIDLSVRQLHKLYNIAKDIWEYRAELTDIDRRRIVNGGLLFLHSDSFISSICDKFWMRNILINEFYKLVSEGVDRDEQKLGAMLILTALVEVSRSAARALPLYR